MGKSKGRPHPALQEETMKFLIEKFGPMLAEFERRTGMKLQLE